MRSLLFKEWELYNVLFIAIFTVMLMANFITVSSIGNISPILVAVPFIWLAPISMALFESKNDSDVLINSLPVTRREVVLSKYVILILFSVVSVGILAVFHMLLQGVFQIQFFPASPISAFIAAYAGIGLFLSIYLPLYFVAGQQFMLYSALTMLALGFIGFLQIIPHMIDIYNHLSNIWQQYTVPQWSVVLFFVTTVLTVLSWLVTTRIYEAKNL